jgi:hypothetical protein
VSAVLGAKESQRKGDSSEYRFASKIRVGYSPTGVQDLSFCPDKSITVTFQGSDLLNDNERFNVLLKADEEPVERLGFLVFPKIGIAVTGFHDGKKSQRALTVYARGAFDVSKFKPYDTAKLRKLSSSK